MKASDYRRDYCAYCSARERAGYEFYSGRAATLDLAPLRDRYADLWTREAVAELEREQAAAASEIERAALSALAGSARLGYAERRAAEVSDELVRCESSSRVEWDGARFGADEVLALLADEPDAARRRELAARRLDALRTCDPLRAARLEALRDAARELNFEDFGALQCDATRMDAGLLAAEAALFLERTTRVYSARLSRWAALSLPPQFARGPEQADAFFFARLPHLDKYFPARDAAKAFESLMAGLGIRAGRVSGGAAAEESERVGRGNARCFAPRAPVDVRLVLAPRAGVDFYHKYFQAAARARQFAWVSPELASRHPEFVHPADGAAASGFGILFRLFFTDPVWIERNLGVASAAAGELATACALVELHDARRACALALDQAELHGAGAADSEAAVETYAARLGEATGFRQAAAQLSDALGEGAPAAEEVRARLFAASFAEYLRTRYGTRWWASRAAGDELIDVWGTAARHPVEELTSLLGAPRPEAELLSASLSAALGR